MSKLILTAKEDDPIWQILLSPTGIYLLVATDRFINIWSTEDKEILSTVPQTTLHQWLNCPSDSARAIGIGFADVQIINWQDPTSTRILTLNRAPLDETTDPTPYHSLFRRPSALYPMSPTETEEVIDETLLSVDGTLSLTVISQRTPQGRREKQYMLINLTNMISSTNTEVIAVALPPDVQAVLSIPLGFLAPDALSGTQRKPSLQRMVSPPPESASLLPAEHMLAFLDHAFWVCTYMLSETRIGRIKRHFILPRDWQNLDWLELAVMRSDGVLLCPRNGEVALVDEGLREEWLE